MAFALFVLIGCSIDASPSYWVIVSIYGVLQLIKGIFDFLGDGK